MLFIQYQILFKGNCQIATVCTPRVHVFMNVFSAEHCVDCDIEHTVMLLSQYSTVNRVHCDVKFIVDRVIGYFASSGIYFC